ncbi:MAG: PAS domain-containing protein [Methylacidiphilales bacterium]|nr:PAS domain-containing protein [Candidatus Methylacidiphilales bacterium]
MTPVSRFKTPEKSLGGLDTLGAAKLIAAAADIALIIDRDGVIEDVSFGSEDLHKEGYGQWLGQKWIDTVTLESRPKVEQLLKEAATGANPRWREISHPAPRGTNLLVRYSTVRLGDDGRVVAIGRDLRTIASLQQRLVAAQQSMEREYARLRHAETRYRLLTSSVIPRPIAWVSTISKDGVLNLAPFSFFNVVSNDPAILVFSPGFKLVMQDGKKVTVKKDTLKNIQETGEFVVNVVTYALAEKMNLTSAEFESHVNEFEKAGVTAAPSHMVRTAARGGKPYQHGM